MRVVQNLKLGHVANIWVGSAAVGCLLALVPLAVFAENPDSPRLLPTDAASLAQPMGAGAQDVQVDARENTAAELWRVLDGQREGNLSDAVRDWKRLNLPASAEPWRNVAIAAAQLELDDFAAAQLTLKKAADLANDNALVQYFCGLLRLEQAARAYEWDDAAGPRLVRTVAYLPDALYPNSKPVYQMAAAHHFELALRLADRIDGYRPLLGPQWADGPTVNDLLEAIGAERYEANCHVLLAEHYLREAMLETAEQHLDQARIRGVDVTYGYRQLADEYEGLGRYADAARAHGKDMQCGTDVAKPLQDMLRTLRLAIVTGG